MIASGSIDGNEYCTSRVATVLTQSVEPGSGTSSTLRPACANQPILVAIANGDAADDTVRAHRATRKLVCALACSADIAAAAIITATANTLVMTHLPFSATIERYRA